MSVRDALKERGLGAQEAVAAPGTPSAPPPGSNLQQQLGGGAFAQEPTGASILEQLQNTLGATSFAGGFIPGPVGAAVAGPAAAGEELVKGAREGKVSVRRALAKGGMVGGGTLLGGKIGEGLGYAGGVITGRIRKQAVQKATEEYAKATQAGTSIDTYDLLKDLKKLTDRAGRAGQSYSEAVVKEAQDFLANKARSQTPLDIHEVRQVSDELAREFHKAKRLGTKTPDPTDKARGAVHKLIADNARKQLRDKVPAATPYEKKASTAINLARWVPKESIPSTASGLLQRTGAGAVGGAMVGGPAMAIPGALINFIASQPQLLQLFGHLIDNPATKGLLQQGGRAAGSMMSE